MRRTAATVTAIALLAGLAAPAFAGGYVYVHRYQLPRDIGRLHTCIAPRQRTIMMPDQVRLGRTARLFEIGCPANAKNVVTFETRAESPNAPKMADEESGPLAYYFADNVRGRNARRLLFPYPKPDGTTLTADAMPLSLDAGWSTRANTSTANNLGFLDPMRGDTPRGEFMLAGRFMPADRPQVEEVFAIWHVKDGRVSLAYWAERTEKAPKDAPSWQLRYTIVTDNRPQR
jgi:hypothetical protein